jgi:hypothetical protein
MTGREGIVVLLDEAMAAKIAEYVMEELALGHHIDHYTIMDAVRHIRGEKS